MVIPHSPDSDTLSLGTPRIRFACLEEPLEILGNFQSLIIHTLWILPLGFGKKFKVLFHFNLATGTSPSARAAHGAVCIETNKIVIYGGATGAGGLASDDLYHLDIKDGIGIWNVINVKDKTPGKRYGHTLSFSKPFLVVFGGNIG